MSEVLDFSESEIQQMLDNLDKFTPEEVQEVEEDSEVEELSEQEQEILDKTVDLLSQQEAEGEYVADQWQEVVHQAEAAGDETYAIVAAATAAFHSQDVTAEEAINYCLQTANLKDLARVYKHIVGS